MANPLCEYFGVCGGCTAQHIDYQQQLENKNKALARAINYNSIEVFSANEYRYRNKLELLFIPNGLGLRKKDKPSQIVEIEKCVIAEDEINNLITEMRNFFKNTDIKTFRYAVVRKSGNETAISFVLRNSSTKLTEATEQITEFAKKTSANNVIITYNNPDTDESASDDFFVVKGSDMLKEKYLSKEFCYSVQGFFQNNHRVAEKMQEHVNQLLKKHETKENTLLDLYAGVGTFGIINADLFKEVFVVENFKQSIDAANKNIENNRIKNAKAFVLDAKQIGRLKLPKGLFIIADPPRSGMEQKAIDKIKELQPEVLIYISCNMEKLSKDIKKFKDYEIKSVAMFDMFPQTPHIEAIAELVKKN